MSRTASAAFMAMLPLPALAAGGSWDESPLGFVLVWVVICLFLSVPAAGVGFLLGSFFKLPASVLLIAILAAMPIGGLWASRGLGPAAELAPILFILLLVLSPLVAVGWHFGRKDKLRHMARSSLLSNGN
jgi:hypothetical protein